MPDDSDVDGLAKSPGRSPGARNVPVWAICHVARDGPAVKIFDAWRAGWRDIRWASARKNLAGTNIWQRVNECK